MLIRRSGFDATILRSWYVPGPGHRWPYALVAVYWVCEHVLFTRAGAWRLGLVTLPQMIAALITAVEQPASGIRIVTVPDIRRAHLPDLGGGTLS